MLEHSEEKPFDCCICDEKFVSLNDLKDHMTEHTGKKHLSIFTLDILPILRILNMPYEKNVSFVAKI